MSGFISMRGKVAALEQTDNNTTNIKAGYIIVPHFIHRWKEVC